MFTYDGSEQSRRGLRYAEWLTAEDSVSVISVATALVEGPRTTAYTDPTSDPTEHRRQLDEALGILADAGVEGEPIAAIGNPAAEIIHAAEAGGIDLIVVGRQGRNAVQRFLMGSVADRVVEHAPCDVLVVR